MPKLIQTAEQFSELAAKAQECRVVRTKNEVRLKLRTPSYLYTYITNADEAEDLIKELKGIEIFEFGLKKEKEKEKDKEKESSSKKGKGPKKEEQEEEEQEQ